MFAPLLYSLFGRTTSKKELNASDCSSPSKEKIFCIGSVQFTYWKTSIEKNQQYKLNAQ